MDTFYEFLESAWASQFIRSGAYFLLALAIATVFHRGLVRAFSKLTAKTTNSIDELLVSRLDRPVYVSILLIGTSAALAELNFSSSIERRLDSVLETVAIILWAAAGSRLAQQILTKIAHREGKPSAIQPRTLPVFVLFAQVFTWVFAAYLAFLAWSIDLTAWLASAGVLGIAVGFAAKDSLANLFAGISILADSSFRVGDFICLDGGVRGRVTSIGVRSTRVLTMDEVEVSVPNALIGNAQIINETGGPGPIHRIRLCVSIAYGSDIQQVRDLLTECGKDVQGVSTMKAPRAIFKAFGESGLDFELQIWLVDSTRLESVTDEVNGRIYNTLNEHNIEIPYNKLDVHLTK